MVLNNLLPPNSEQHAFDPRHPNREHDFNTTNFHTHGWHISPAGNSDNVLIKLDPGKRLTYEFNLPRDHPAGTFWYHPHRHGSTSIQVASGMGGALIVAGGLDNEPTIASAEDQIMILQQIPYETRDGLGVLEHFSHLQGDYKCGPKANPINPCPIFVNGQKRPVIAMRPGEVQRWRFIQAGIMRVVLLSLENHDLHVIAWDGLATGRIDAEPNVELAPGNRADILVKAGRAGRYKLMVRTQRPTGGSAASLRLSQPSLLATLIVGGARRGMALPDSSALAKYKPFTDITPAQVNGHNKDVIFAKKPRNAFNFYNINGERFDANKVGYTLKLGAYEQWKLTSDEQNHPFHIHVNPFMVTKIGDRDLNPPRWMDTILVRRDEPVVMYTHYRRYIGNFVFHCHFLNHEDRGMMWLVEIVP
ncbi:MAG TPA: multicopper oxidase family protein [Acidobacteriota bacterium]|nr:multicopper oxidase family protein [Acidobacteriota bacterium]